METALVGRALPEVIKKIQELLVRMGYRVQVIEDQEMVILAEHHGSWYKTTRQLVLHLSQEANKITRIDVTAILFKNKGREAEEIVEEKIVESIYKNLHTTINASYGI